VMGLLRTVRDRGLVCTCWESLLLGRIWSPIELCFRDCVRSMGGVHRRPMAAKRVFSEIDDAYEGTRDLVEMALDSTSTEGVL
jgi:hypothetical protein